MNLTKIQEQILIGHLLGDGTLEFGKNSKNASFKLLRALKDKDYLLWTANYFKDFITPVGIQNGSYYDKRTNKTYYHSRFRTKCDSIFTEYYEKWYKDKIKIIPDDLILTPLTIAVWFADDGNVQHRTKHALEIKFSTNGFSKEETYKLKNMLSCYGEFKVYKDTDKEQYKIYACTKSAKALFRDIDPIFPLERKSKIWRLPEVDLWDENESPNCGYCGSSNVYKNGTSRGKQKFHCQNCKKQFQRIEDYVRKSKYIELIDNNKHIPIS